ALLGMLLAAVPAAVFSLLYYLLRGQEGFGMGDLKLLAALGLYLGLAGLWVLPLACVCAVLVMLCQVIFRMLVRLPHHFQQTDTRQTGIPTREKVQRHTIAFGPFIALAAVILVVVG
ncbi:MAG: hypothetical protein FWF11_04830, partial [Coriobacteriia bacterium]|nr:hypothetical protein [Coriobacteriia bacterium]